MIVIPAGDAASASPGQAGRDVCFRQIDDVYTTMGDHAAPRTIPGVVVWDEEMAGAEPESWPRHGSETVRLVVGQDNRPSAPQGDWFRLPCGGRARVRGAVRHDSGWAEDSVRLIPLETDLFLPFAGILEVGWLAHLWVLVIALGSIGSSVLMDLVKSAIRNVLLLDHDRLDLHNVCRHQADIRDLGRYKTKVMADLARSKNPYINVRTFETAVSGETIGLVRELVRQASLVVCTADSRECRLLVNQICLQEGRTVIFSGAWRRAYGGQVLRVRPGVSPCYQCFLLSTQEDTEVSSLTQAKAAGLVYTDRPVPVEPGLAIDISPISQMTSRLCLQELLRGRQTTLRSLDQDLAADRYIWLNRREAGTPFEGIEPLGCGVDGLRVCRSYGVAAERVPHCPACGDYASFLARQYGIGGDASGNASQQ